MEYDSHADIFDSEKVWDQIDLNKKKECISRLRAKYNELDESVIEWMLHMRRIRRESLSKNYSKSPEVNLTSLAPKDDTPRAFCDIHSTSEHMRRQMIEISFYCSKRTATQQWTEDMRFIGLDWFENSEDFKEQTNYHLKADEHRSFKPFNVCTGSKPARFPGLKLKNRKSLADSSSYVAVSYCWNREQVE